MCGPAPVVTCTGGLFQLPTSAHTVLAHVVVILLLALCGGDGGGGGYIYIFSYLRKMINSSKYNVQRIATHVYTRRSTVLET